MPRGIDPGAKVKVGDLVEVYSPSSDRTVEAKVTKVAKNQKSKDARFVYEEVNSRQVGDCPISWYRDRLGWMWGQRSKP